MTRTVKTAIALPREDFQLVETIRKETGKSRSQIFVEAFRSWVAARQKKQLDDKYAEGYRRIPEDLTEIDALARASSSVWGKDEW
jgi:hypothetical protein